MVNEFIPDNILDRIEIIRIHLEKGPSNIIFGEIKIEKTPRSYHIDDPLRDYYDMLNRYSYLSCGSILIIGYKKLERFQHYLLDIPDCASNWKCIGKSHTYPIFLNINDCSIKILQGEPWAGQDLRSYGHFSNFINEYVVGGKYKELWGEDDWYRFLIKIGMV